MRNVVEPATEAAPTVQLEHVESGTSRLTTDLPLLGPDGQNSFSVGDVLFSKLRPYLAKSLLITVPMQGTSEFLCLRPVRELDPRFLKYVTLSRPWLDHAMQSAYGSKMPRTSWDQMASFELPDLRVEEQRRIADFLDDRVARIDQIIAARTAQLVLVHELEGNRLKLAVRGLTGSSPSTRLGRIARIHSGTSFPEDLDADGPYPVVGGNGEMGRGALANAGPGTVVVGRVGALCGNVHLLTEQAWVTDNALVVQGTTTSFDSPFVAATLHAYDLNSIAAKTAQPLVTGTQIADQRIPLVDTTQRQRVIELWENERRADERGLARLQAAIDLLQEYKQSLITAAVTGEFDVTTAAPIPE